MRRESLIFQRFQRHLAQLEIEFDRGMPCRQEQRGGLELEPAASANEMEAARNARR